MPVLIPVNTALPSYTQTTDLDGERWRLRFRYRSRLQCWFLDIFDRNGNPVLMGRALVAGGQIAFSRLDAPQGFITIGQEAIAQEDLGIKLRILYYSAEEIAAFPTQRSAFSPRQVLV